MMGGRGSYGTNAEEVYAWIRKHATKEELERCKLALESVDNPKIVFVDCEDKWEYDRNHSTTGLRNR